LGFVHIAFEYPKKKVMMLKDNREVSSQNSSSSSSDKGCKLSPSEGDLLMIRLMIGHIKNILKKLKEKIFFTQLA